MDHQCNIADQTSNSPTLKPNPRNETMQTMEENHSNLCNYLLSLQIFTGCMHSGKFSFMAIEIVLEGWEGMHPELGFSAK